jgi:hypothetical protein
LKVTTRDSTSAAEHTERRILDGKPIPPAVRVDVRGRIIPLTLEEDRERLGSDSKDERGIVAARETALAKKIIIR